MESESNAVNVTSPEATPFAPSSFENLNAVWNQSCVWHKGGLEPFFQPMQDFPPDVKVTLIQVDSRDEHKEIQQRTLYFHSIVMAGASEKLKDVLSSAQRNSNGQKEMTFKSESMDALLCFSLLFYCPHVIELVDYKQLKLDQTSTKENFNLSLSVLVELWILAKTNGCINTLNHITVYLVLDLFDVERNTPVNFLSAFKKLTEHVSTITRAPEPAYTPSLFTPSRYFCHMKRHTIKAGAFEHPHLLISEPELANEDMLTYWVLDTLVGVQQNHYWSLWQQLPVQSLEVLCYITFSYINQLSFCEESRRSGILFGKWQEFVVFFAENVCKFPHGELWLVWIEPLMKLVADNFFSLLVVQDNPKAAMEELEKFPDLIAVIQSNTRLYRVTQKALIQLLYEWTPVIEREEEKESKKESSSNN